MKEIYALGSERCLPNVGLCDPACCLARQSESVLSEQSSSLPLGLDVDKKSKHCPVEDVVRSLIQHGKAFLHVDLSLDHLTKAVKEVISVGFNLVAKVSDDGVLFADQFVKIVYLGLGGAKGQKPGRTKRVAKRDGGRIGRAVMADLALASQMPQLEAKMMRLAGLALGKKIGKAVPAMRDRTKTMFGIGDYSENTNSLVAGGSFVKKAPSFGRHGTIDVNSVTFSHRNNFASLVVPTDGAFTVQSYLVTPNNSTLFPMLARYAEMYEKVEFVQLIFDFESHTSPYNSGAAMGTVMLGWLNNPDEIDYTTEEEFLNSGDAVSGRPDKNLVYGVECGPKPKMLYSQNNFVSGNNAIGNYALGKIQVGSSVGTSFAAGSILGRVRTSYTVRCTGVRLKRDISGSVIGQFSQSFTGLQMKEVNSTYTGFTNPTIADTLGTPGPSTSSGTLLNMGVSCVTAGKYRLIIPSNLMSTGDKILVTFTWDGFPWWTREPAHTGMSLKASGTVTKTGPVANAAYNGTYEGVVNMSVTDIGNTSFYQHTQAGQQAIGRYMCQYNGTSVADIILDPLIPGAVYPDSTYLGNETLYVDVLCFSA